MSSVLRLGVYRERIERYGNRPPPPVPPTPQSRPQPQQQQHMTKNQKAEQQQPVRSAAHTNGSSSSNGAVAAVDKTAEELLTVTLERQAGRQLGIRLSGNCSEPGIFIVEIQEGSTTAADGRLQRFDRLLFINGQDVRHSRLPQASALIQVKEKMKI